MYSDIVKVDSKGRITIPSAIRLLFGVEEGDKLILLIDEEEQKIELRNIKTSNLVICRMVDNLGNVIESLSKISGNVIAFNCRCYDASCSKFKCRFIVEEKILRGLSNSNLQCFSTNP